MGYKLQIEKVDNGYVLEWSEPQEEGDDAVFKQVFEEDEEMDEGHSNMSIVKLLYAISEQLGFFYDKYRDKNLNIDWSKRGHKLQDDGK